MSAEQQYEITFSISRGADLDDMTEIGFGASGAWGTPEDALHWIASQIQNYEWETEPGQPDPDDVKTELELHRDQAGGAK